MAVNKVVRSDGTTLIDITDTTAVAADVAQGKYFYAADGTLTEGTASGGGGTTRTVIVPEQTINVSTAYNQITNYVSLIEEGEEYIVTLNGVEYVKTAVSYYGSIALLLYTDVYIERTSSNNLFFDVENSSLYGTYTIKVEQESSGGGGGMNVQGYHGMDYATATSYTATDVTLTVEKSGTYTVSWMGFRNTNSGTSGSQLYINGTAYGSAQTTFTSTYGQFVTLTGVSLSAGDVLVVRAIARSTSYRMYVGNLIIEQTA